MRVLVSGSSGLIGSAVVVELEKSAHRVLRLVRSEPAASDHVLWDPVGRHFDAQAAEGADAMVHLAGENIGSGRWSAAKKHRIRQSRVVGTRFLAESLLSLERPPRVVVAASAVGIYGDRGDEVLDEEAIPGAGFLAEVCREWEAAAGTLRAHAIRVVNLRFGVVLSASGGALRRMLPPFRLGLGGRLGRGDQWMSWIAEDDAAGVVSFALHDEGLEGPVNAVSPQPLSNAEFARTLGGVLGRPALFSVPGFALRLVLGEMAQALLLSSTRAVPAALVRRGYAFRHAELGAALRSVLGVGERRRS